MRLDLKVLWIDDQPRHIHSVREAIQGRLQDEGFHLEVVEASGLDGVAEHIGTDIQSDGIDLVLVDYDLGAGSGGDQVLTLVKQRFPYKDIVFYSAEGTDNLRRIAFEQKVDGVYFSTRHSLADDVYENIRSMLRKIMDVDHMRGIVMSASSDIDYIIEETLLKIDGKRTETEQATYRVDVIARLNKKLGGWATDLGKAEKKDSFGALLRLRSICGADERLKMLIRVLESKVDSPSTQIEMAKVYRDEVIPRRNKLAHVILKVNNGEKVLAGESEDNQQEVFTSEDLTKLRCDLIEHRTNFNGIAELEDVVL